MLIRLLDRSFAIRLRPPLPSSFPRLDPFLLPIQHGKRHHEGSRRHLRPDRTVQESHRDLQPGRRMVPLLPTYKVLCQGDLAQGRSLVRSLPLSIILSSSFSGLSVKREKERARVLMILFVAGGYQCVGFGGYRSSTNADGRVRCSR
jgi:hypothetical protein